MSTDFHIYYRKLKLNPNSMYFKTQKISHLMMVDSFIPDCRDGTGNCSSKTEIFRVDRKNQQSKL